MKNLSAAILALALALPISAAQIANAQSTTVEKKTTTTNPNGMVVVESETSRTFTLQGQTHVYTAPADTDLRSLSGKEVTVFVDPSGAVTKIERKTTTVE